MTVTRTDSNQVFDGQGNVISEQIVEVDITAEVVDWELAVRLSDAMGGLRQIINSTGTLTGLQLSNAVRLLARVALSLIRRELRRLEDPE